MKLFLGGILVLVVAKFATAHGYHMGILSMLLLWLFLSWKFPRHIGSPMQPIKQYGKVMLSKRMVMPLFGWTIYMSVPMALPVFVVVWLYMALWRKRRAQYKPKYRPVGTRLDYRERKHIDALRQRTKDIPTKVVGGMAVVGSRVGTAGLRHAQTIQRYYQRHRRKSVQSDHGRDGNGQDELRQEAGEATN